MKVAGTFYRGVFDPPDGQASIPGIWTTDYAPAEKFARLGGVVLVAHELLLTGEKANGTYLGTAVGEVEGYRLREGAKHEMLDDMEHDQRHLDELGRPYLPASFSLSAEGYPVIGYKFNPHHDARGRFAKTGGGGSAYRSVTLSAEEERLAIDYWVRGTGVDGVRDHSMKMLRGEDVDLSNPDARVAAGFLNSVDHGKRHAVLYRGMNISDEWAAKYKASAGKRVRVGLSSFTSKSRIAEACMQEPGAGLGRGQGPVKTLVRLKNAKGWDISRHPSTASFQREFGVEPMGEVISAGLFRITSVHRRKGVLEMEWEAE